MNTNKKIKTLLPILFLFLFLMPILTLAFDPLKDPIIPDCGKLQDCGYVALLQLVNNVISWIIMIAVPVAAGVFAWAGIKYMTTGVSDQKSAAKAMIQKVFIGLVFILAAWIIVGTISKALLKDPNSIPVQINLNKLTNLYV
jgi:hypothetical protein